MQCVYSCNLYTGLVPLEREPTLTTTAYSYVYSTTCMQEKPKFIRVAMDPSEAIGICENFETTERTAPVLYVGLD